MKENTFQIDFDSSRKQYEVSKELMVCVSNTLKDFELPGSK